MVWCHEQDSNQTSLALLVEKFCENSEFVFGKIGGVLNYFRKYFLLFIVFKVGVLGWWFFSHFLNESFLFGYPARSW